MISCYSQKAVITFNMYDKDSFMRNLLALSSAIVVIITIISTPAMADEQIAQVMAQSTIDIQRAITIGNNSLKGDIISIAFDQNDSSMSGIYAMEIIASNLKYEITIDANSGKMVAAEQDKLNAADMTAYNTMKRANISLVQAITNATKIVNGQVAAAEFDLNQGKAVYQIEIINQNKRHKMTIDAMSGNVINNRIETDDSDDD